MQPTALTCRAQEAHQRGVSLNASLANVRQIAALAAAAWAKEAIAAERREARATHARQDREPAKILHLPLWMDDRALSESPDRGFADA